jgi:hypothetical protein
MADAAGLNPAAARRGGSNPSSGTTSATRCHGAWCHWCHVIITCTLGSVPGPAEPGNLRKSAPDGPILPRMVASRAPHAQMTRPGPMISLRSHHRALEASSGRRRAGRRAHRRSRKDPSESARRADDRSCPICRRADRARSRPCPPLMRSQSACRIGTSAAAAEDPAPLFARGRRCRFRPQHGMSNAPQRDRGR